MDIEIPQEALPKNSGGGEKDFSALPDGYYNAIIVDVKVREFPSGKGLNVAYRISDGDHTNRQVFENYPYHMDIRWKLTQLLDATGYDVKSGIIKNFKPSDLMGSPVRIKVEQTEKGEKTYNNVRFVNPPPGGAAPKTATGFSL